MARPRWAPSPDDRNQVEAMATYGIPEKDIALIMGVAPGTLRRHCREELDKGLIKARAKVGAFILNSILGRDGGIKNEQSRATLAMFYAKTQMGWKETVVAEHTNKDGKAFVIAVSKTDWEL